MLLFRETEHTPIACQIHQRVIWTTEPPKLYYGTDNGIFQLKVKAEHLYSALHGIQTTLKRLGMDHTV